MIVAEKMEEAVQRQDPKLNGQGMAQLAGLAPGDSRGNGDVAQESRA